MSGLEQTARTTVSDHALLPGGAPVLAMVSGGGDSVALLHLLASGVFGELPLRVLHVNHMLRGDEANADEAFVVRLCEKLGVSCHAVRYDVSAFAAEHGLNLEDAGRRVRYRFADAELDAWCETLRTASGAGRIALAHTRDDRVETFFMRAIAGAGSGALASIARQRGRVVRPLIDCDREDVRAYLAEHALEWREDATNSDTARTRAFVRARLVPVAAELNPAFRVSLARTMDLLGDDDALLARMADGFVRGFADIAPGEVRFERECMRTLERTMARRVMRAALIEAFPEASRIEAAHVDALVTGLASDAFARDLPGGLSARTEYATLVVSYADAEAPCLQPALLTLPGHADLGAAGEVFAEETGTDDTSGTAHSIVIDAGRTSGALVVDALRDGDRMRPFGMDGSRKLSDLLIDAKVPKRLRRMRPVVRDGERIVWLAGVRMSEEYRVTPETRRSVRVTWKAGEATESGTTTGAGA